MMFNIDLDHADWLKRPKSPVLRLVKYSPDEERDSHGRWLGQSVDPAQVKTRADLERVAAVGALPPDDGKYRYFYHYVDTRATLDSVKETGVHSERAGKVWLAKEKPVGADNTSAGFAIVRVPRTQEVKEGTDSSSAAIGAYRYTEYTVPSVPPEDVLGTIRQVSAGPVWSVPENELAQLALDNQGVVEDDLQEEYKHWFTVDAAAKVWTPHLVKYSEDEARDDRGRWFHSTSSEAADKIQAEGFKASAGHFGTGVYLASNKDEAGYGDALLTASHTAQNIGSPEDTARITSAAKAEGQERNPGKYVAGRDVSDRTTELARAEGFDGLSDHYGNIVVFDPSKVTVASAAKLFKYNEEEERDSQGRWTSGGDSGPIKAGDMKEGDVFVHGNRGPITVQNVGEPNANGYHRVTGVDGEGKTQSFWVSGRKEFDIMSTAPKIEETQVTAAVKCPYCRSYAESMADENYADLHPGSDPWKDAPEELAASTESILETMDCPHEKA